MKHARMEGEMGNGGGEVFSLKVFQHFHLFLFVCFCFPISELVINYLYKLIIN